jgi:ribosomal protein S18 acetylase RimI-like enzyme
VPDIDIQPLTQLSAEDFKRIAVGYTSTEMYRPTRTESDGQIVFTLERVKRSEPYVKRWPFTEANYATCINCLPQGVSVGAATDGKLVGIAVAELREWGKSINVWEFHVDEAHHRQGIGKRLIQGLVDRARAIGLRQIVCEAQSTNVPVFDFYRRQGFKMEGIDLTFYDHDESCAEEFAVFMKRVVT